MTPLFIESHQIPERPEIITLGDSYPGMSVAIG